MAATTSVFAVSSYGPEVEAILALDGAGKRLMPLASGTCSCEEAFKRLKATNADELFYRSHAPEAAMSGMYLYFSCLEESHNISQTVETPDGSFWHAIMHRQEPDAGNANYWFRRAGRHPIFPALAAAAESLGYPAGSSWNPFVFIDACEEARRNPGSEREKLIQRVQLAEWQLLFHYCARTS